MLRAPGSRLSRALFLGGAAACVSCWLALAGCGSRTGFLDGDGSSLSDDDATGEAGSGGSAGSDGIAGSAGASGLGFAGSSMVGAGGSFVQAPPDIDEPTPSDLARECGADGRLDGDVVILSSADVALLEGCTELRGNLTIQASVADLSPLRQLVRVRGTLAIVGGPPSLAGLEGLTQVQNLDLDSIAALTLQPLSGLQRVRRLSIRGSVPQGDLSGLGGIVSLRELTLGDSSLPSLAGLSVPASMFAISIVNSTISDASVLAGVSQIVQNLALINVRGLTTLDAFSSLTSVRALNLGFNPDLVQIDGLANLSQVDSIGIEGHPRLEHVPDFEAIRFAEGVAIINNAVLSNFPRFSQLERVTQLLIEDNPALERVDLPTLGAPAGSTDQSSIVIARNRALTRISAAALRATGSLAIAENSTLTTVELPSLLFVADRFDVVMNPLLGGTSLDPLRRVTSAQTKIGANQGDTPLASCPWTNDDRCDETSSVCTAGSDLVDCNGGYPPW
jgi:hypothetical protein